MEGTVHDVQERLDGEEYANSVLIPSLVRKGVTGERLLEFIKRVEDIDKNTSYKLGMLDGLRKYGERAVREDIGYGNLEVMKSVRVG